MSEIIPRPERPERIAPEPRRPRMALIYFFALSILSLGIYTGWWVWLASETERHVQAWFDEQRARGMTAEFDDFRTGGFPLKVRADLFGVRLGDPAAEWTVTMPAIYAAADPWDIASIAGAVVTPVQATLVRGRMAGRYVLTAEANTFRVEGNRIDLNVIGLDVARAGTAERIAIETLSTNLETGTGTTFGVVHLDATGMILPQTVRSPFGEEIAALSAHIEMLVRPAAAGTPRQRLRTWSESGGTIEVRALDIRHGVLTLTGDGTVALDPDLQPVGAFAARIAGYNPAIDALVRTGVVGRQEGALAKAALGFFAKVPPGGGRKVIDVPLTVQDRRLSVGPVPLVKLPRVRWD